MTTSFGTTLTFTLATPRPVGAANCRAARFVWPRFLYNLPARHSWQACRALGAGRAPAPPKLYSPVVFCRSRASSKTLASAATSATGAARVAPTRTRAGTDSNPTPSTRSLGPAAKVSLRDRSCCHVCARARVCVCVCVRVRARVHFVLAVAPDSSRIQGACSRRAHCLLSSTNTR